MYTSRSDPYRHVKGIPDLPSGGFGLEALPKWLAQGRPVPLIQVPPVPISREEYRARRDNLRTGRRQAMNGYNAWEYALPDGTSWATEELCLSLADVFSIATRFTEGMRELGRDIFLGFPMRMESAEGYWYIDNLEQRPISDDYFIG